MASTTAATTMDAGTIARIAATAVDLSMYEDGGYLSHLEISEHGDGSRRTCGIATTINGEHEQTYRILSPAPWNAPVWASVHRDWTVEVRTDDTWLDLEIEA